MNLFILSILLILNNIVANAGEFNNRFQPHKDSSLILQATKGDEGALEANYSFKFLFLDCKYTDTDILKSNLCSCDENINNSFYFKYNGEFDFYLGTRDSGPVINRTSNPGFHFRKEYLDDSFLKWVDYAVEHRSDGQVTEIDLKDENPASPTFGQYKTQIAYDNNDHKYFDGLSRGSNYFSLEAQKDFKSSGVISLKVKGYFHHDTDVNWGPDAANNPSILDYDLLNITYKKTFTLPSENEHFKEYTLKVKYTLGEGLLDTHSADISLYFPWISKKGKAWEVPIMVKAHLGPMDRLSDYTKTINSVGIGIGMFY